MGVGGQTPRPDRLPRERPSTHCTGGWVGTRAGLDRCGKSRPPTGIRSRTFKPVVNHYTVVAFRIFLRTRVRGLRFVFIYDKTYMPYWKNVEAILDSRNGLDMNGKDSNFRDSHQSAGHTHVDFKKQLGETGWKWHSVCCIVLIAVCFDRCLIFFSASFCESYVWDTRNIACDNWRSHC